CSPLDSIRCNDATAALEVTALPTTGNTIIGQTWLPGGATTPTITVNDGSTYTVTVTQSNGCTATSSCSVVVDTCRPSVTVSNNGPISCTNTIRTVNAVGTACYNYNLAYSWSNGAAGQNATVTAGGPYTVTVTQLENGCTVTGTTTMAMDTCHPAITASNNGPITCANPTRTVSSSASVCPNETVSYLWSNSNSGASFTTSDANTYSVTITQNGNGCSATASTTLTVDTCKPSVTASNDGPITCSNPTPTVNASATGCLGETLDYLWSNSETGISFTTGSDNTYTVTVTQTGNGCTAVASTILLRNDDAPLVSCSPLDSIRCNDATAALEVTALPTTGNTIIGQTWLPGGATTPTITVND
ncbi:MAG: hypothetical protein ACKOQ6_00265, partial [Bacteroidota bacterium]